MNIDICCLPGMLIVAVDVGFMCQIFGLPKIVLDVI
jgi:hypothetical protein